jgi:nuclear receptor subfamily 0 group A
MVGMSKNGSRYGRRSNWFKIHCLLQEQQQQREQQQQHQQQSQNHQPQPHDLMFLNLMDDYNKNRASLSSSSPSISSPDSHNSDSSVEIGDKKKINSMHKIPPKMPTAVNPPLPSQLASFFQLMPPLGPLPLHLVGSPFTKLMPPPPLASQNFLPPSLFANPFHDSLHHLYAQQQQFLSSANLSSPLANLTPNNNNNNKDSINNNLLHNGGTKGTDFYQKYYFNKIHNNNNNGKFNDEHDENENDVTPSNSPPLKVDVNSPASSPSHHSTSSNSPIICDDAMQNNPIDLSMKNEDLLNNNTN